MKEIYYNDKFYERYINKSISSAKSILGLLYKIYKPDSIVDFGCGKGGWLVIAESLGSVTLRGYDGTWVTKENLLSDKIDFTQVNFEDTVSLERKYDLAMCMEIAEHLPETKSRSFIRTLCDASDVVLFSAAIKNQGGANHINEQWQSYWINIFKANGYECFDIFRAQIWENEEVELWYRQNTFLFVNSHADTIDKQQLLPMEKQIYNIIHPEYFEDRCNIINNPTFLFCLRLLRRYFYNKLGVHYK